MVCQVENPKSKDFWFTSSHTQQTGAPPPYIYAIILYMTTLPIANYRAQLSKLVDEASSTH